MMEKQKTFRQFLAENYDNQYQYSSTQVNVPEEIAKDILDWSDENVPDAMIYTDPDDPTFGREDEPHVTVLYGLHTAEPRLVSKVLEREKPGQVALGKLSIFTSNDKFDVLKIDVKSDTLHHLHKVFSNNLKATDSYPEYVPHVTIAYVKKGKADKFVGEDVFSGKSFEADKVIFSSKNGTRTKIAIGGK